MFNKLFYYHHMIVMYNCENINNKYETQLNLEFYENNIINNNEKLNEFNNLKLLKYLFMILMFILLVVILLLDVKFQNLNKEIILLLGLFSLIILELMSIRQINIFIKNFPELKYSNSTIINIILILICFIILIISKNYLFCITLVLYIIFNITMYFYYYNQKNLIFILKIMLINILYMLLFIGFQYFSWILFLINFIILGLIIINCEIVYPQQKDINTIEY